MRAIAILNELQTAGVSITATPDGDLELDAPRGVLTGELLTTLREYKEQIVGLLSRLCPYCGSRGMRQESSVKESLLYVDTLCRECGELVECFVPAQQNIHFDAEVAARGLTRKE